MEQQNKKKTKAEVMVELIHAGTIYIKGKPRCCATPDLLDYLAEHCVHPCLCCSKKPIDPERIEAWANEITREGLTINWTEVNTVEQFMDRQCCAGVLLGNETYLINSNLIANLMRYIAAKNGKEEGYMVVTPSDIRLLRNLKSGIEQALKALPKRVEDVINNITT